MSSEPGNYYSLQEPSLLREYNEKTGDELFEIDPYIFGGLLAPADIKLKILPFFDGDTDQLYPVDDFIKSFSCINFVKKNLSLFEAFTADNGNHGEVRLNGHVVPLRQFFSPILKSYLIGLLSYCALKHACPVEELLLLNGQINVHQFNCHSVDTITLFLQIKNGPASFYGFLCTGSTWISVLRTLLMKWNLHDIFYDYEFSANNKLFFIDIICCAIFGKNKIFLHQLDSLKFFGQETYLIEPTFLENHDLGKFSFTKAIEIAQWTINLPKMSRCKYSNKLIQPDLDAFYGGLFLESFELALVKHPLSALMITNGLKKMYDEIVPIIARRGFMLSQPVYVGLSPFGRICHFVIHRPFIQVTACRFFKLERNKESDIFHLSCFELSINDFQPEKIKLYGIDVRKSSSKSSSSRDYFGEQMLDVYQKIRDDGGFKIPKDKFVDPLKIFVPNAPRRSKIEQGISTKHLQIEMNASEKHGSNPDEFPVMIMGYFARDVKRWLQENPEFRAYSSEEGPKYTALVNSDTSTALSSSKCYSNCLEVRFLKNDSYHCKYDLKMRVERVQPCFNRNGYSCRIISHNNMLVTKISVYGSTIPLMAQNYD